MIGLNSASPLSNVFQATYTGGAPGTPSHAWEVAPGSPWTSVAFANPLNSSNQRIQLTGVAAGNTETALIRDKITASDGQFSYTPNVTVSYERILVGP